LAGYPIVRVLVKLSLPNLIFTVYSPLGDFEKSSVFFKTISLLVVDPAITPFLSNISKEIVF